MKDPDPTQVQRVNDFLSGKALRLNTGEFLETCIHYWGGMQKFARDVVREFKSARKYKQRVVSQRIIGMMLHILADHSKITGGDALPVEQFDTDDLKRMAMTIIKGETRDAQLARGETQTVPAAEGPAAPAPGT